MLIDTHAHLDDSRFETDLDEVVVRAGEAGVEKILTLGTDSASSRANLQLALKHRSVYVAVGFHPHQAASFDDATTVELERLAAYPKVVAIGEIGLDYYRKFSPPEVQRQAFRSQIRFAKRLKLPISIHNRDADDDLLTILQEEYEPDLYGVAHSFFGDLEFAQKLLELGLFLGVSGPITFKKEAALREVIQAVPLDRLLIETDAPYLTPVPYRGKRNEPAYVRYVAAKLAEIKGISIETVAQVTTENAIGLFGLNSGKES